MSSDLYKLFKKIIPLNSIGVKYISRKYNHWKQDGLIESQEDGRNIKLNAIDLVWVSIINELRCFGFPLSKIKKVKSELFGNAKFEEMEKLGLLPTDFKANISNEINNAGFTEDEVNALQKLLRQGNFFSYFNQFNLKIKVIENLILYCIKQKAEVGILVGKDGGITEYTEKMLLSFPEMLNLFSNSHIYISITKILLDFFGDYNNDKFSKVFTIPSKIEFELVKFLRLENFNDVSIRVDKGITYISGKAKFIVDDNSLDEFEQKFKFKYKHFDLEKVFYDRSLKVMNLTIKKKIYNE